MDNTERTQRHQATIAEATRLKWPNRVWEKSGNFHEDGSPLWNTREPGPGDFRPDSIRELRRGS